MKTSLSWILTHIYSSVSTKNSANNLFCWTGEVQRPVLANALSILCEIFTQCWHDNVLQLHSADFVVQARWQKSSQPSAKNTQVWVYPRMLAMRLTGFFYLVHTWAEVTVWSTCVPPPICLTYIFNYMLSTSELTSFKKITKAKLTIAVLRCSWCFHSKAHLCLSDRSLDPTFPCVPTHKLVLHLDVRLKEKKYIYACYF